MLLELEKHGWERDNFADVIFDGDVLLFSYSHPCYPRCSLVIDVKINFIHDNCAIWPDRVRTTLGASLALDGDEVEYYYEDNLSPAHITKIAAQYQQEEENGTNSA